MKDAGLVLGTPTFLVIVLIKDGITPEVETD